MQHDHIKFYSHSSGSKATSSESFYRLGGSDLFPTLGNHATLSLDAENKKKSDIFTEIKSPGIYTTDIGKSTAKTYWFPFKRKQKLNI